MCACHRAGGRAEQPRAHPQHLPSDTQNGTLKIIDRKKHIFKLAQGEYIAPEKIENIYVRSEPVAQVFVHGESLQVCAFCAEGRDGQVRRGLVLRRSAVPLSWPSGCRAEYYCGFLPGTAHPERCFSLNPNPMFFFDLAGVVWCTKGSWIKALGSG